MSLSVADPGGRGWGGRVGGLQPPISATYHLFKFSTQVPPAATGGSKGAYPAMAPHREKGGKAGPIGGWAAVSPPPVLVLPRTKNNLGGTELW